MTKDDTIPTPYDAPLAFWQAAGYDEEKYEVITMQQARDEVLHLPPHVRARDLDGETFDIIGAKAFVSSFEGQDHAYFCVCRDLQGERFSVVLGGAALVDVLDALIANNNTRALRVTLRFNPQGRYGGYYLFE